MDKELSAEGLKRMVSAVVTALKALDSGLQSVVVGRNHQNHKTKALNLLHPHSFQ